jgi:hypothetical protein
LKRLKKAAQKKNSTSDSRRLIAAMLDKAYNVEDARKSN